MVSKDESNPTKKCVSQDYDGSNNMMGMNTGAAVRVKEACPLGAENHCLRHTDSLQCKVVRSNVTIVSTFQSQTFESLNLTKKALNVNVHCNNTRT